MIRVVFDTNVVVSACFWRGAPFDCLMAWAEKQVCASVSPPLLFEYEETYEELFLDYGNRQVVNWVEILRQSAEMVFPIERATGATPDPFDEMVLECALASETDLIVSGDKKHLLSLEAFRGIPIVSPAGFLRRIR